MKKTGIYSNIQARKYYEFILEIYKKLFVNQKCKSYKISCTIKFKKVKNDRIGVMKIDSISEVQKIKRRGPMISPLRLMQKNAKKIQDLQKSKLLSLKSNISDNPSENISKQNSLQFIKKNNICNRMSSNNKNTPELKETNKFLALFKKNQKENGLGYQLPEEQNNENQGQDEPKEENYKLIDWESFQQQFKKSHGALNISLNPADNVFRKEENNKPRKYLTKISYLTWFLRLMFFSIILMNLFTFLYGPNREFAELIARSDRVVGLGKFENSILEAYDLTLDIILYSSENSTFQELSYQNHIMRTKDEFLAYEQLQINDNYQKLKVAFVDQKQQETFLDKNLVASEVIQDTSIGIEMDLDQQDFYSKFMQHLLQNTSSQKQHELKQMDIEQLSLVSFDQSSIQFIRFITIPFLYNIFENGIFTLYKYMPSLQIFSSINDNVDQIEFLMIIILILEGCIFLIGFIGLLKIILWIRETFRQNIRHYQKHCPGDFQQYLKQLQRSIQFQFKYILTRDDEIAGIFESDTKIYNKSNSIASEKNQKYLKSVHQMGNFLLSNEEDQIQNANYNKKVRLFLFYSGQSRTILQGNLMRKLTVKMSISYIILVGISVGASLAFHLTVKQSTDSLQLLLKNGRVCIEQFSDSMTLLILLKVRYLNETHYDQILYPEVEDIVKKTLVRIKETPSPDYQDFGNYYTRFQTIFFSDLCSLLQNENVINAIQQDECERLSLKKLSDGLVVFNQYFVSKIEDLIYLNDNVKRFGDVSSSDIWELTLSLDYVTSAYSFLIQTWSDDMKQELEKYLTMLIILISMMVAVQFLIFAFIAEHFLVAQLNSTYNFYRQVYKSFMPNDIIQKEKIIRAKLIIYNIIKK